MGTLLLHHLAATVVLPFYLILTPQSTLHCLIKTLQWGLYTTTTKIFSTKQILKKKIECLLNVHMLLPIHTHVSRVSDFFYYKYLWRILPLSTDLNFFQSSSLFVTFFPLFYYTDYELCQHQVIIQVTREI